MNTEITNMDSMPKPTKSVLRGKAQSLRPTSMSTSTSKDAARPVRSTERPQREMAYSCNSRYSNRKVSVVDTNRAQL